MRRRHPAGPPAAVALGAAVLLSGGAAAAAPPAPATASPTTLTSALTPALTSALTPASSTPVPSTGPSTGPAPGPSTDQAPAGAGLEVQQVLPAELRPGGRVVVRGRVSGGEAGLVAARVELRRAGSRVSSVSSLERWTAAVDDRPGPAAGDAPFDDPAATARTEVAVDLGDVAPGATVPFAVTVEADDTGLRDSAGAAGAYGMQLLLLAEEAGTGSTDGAAGTDEAGDVVDVVDDERGFLVWSPEVDVAPTRLSTTVVLQGPAPLPETGLPDPGTLVGQAVPGARLDRLLGAAGALDADWVVDPVLLAGMALAADPTAGGVAPAPEGSAAAPDAPLSSAGPSAPSSAPPTAGSGASDGSGASGASGGTAGAAAGPSTGDPGPSDDAAPPSPSVTPTEPDGGPTGGPTGEATGEATGGPAGGSSGVVGGTTVQGQAGVARRWLDALAAARGDREVVLADWADPDPARLRSADDVEQAWATVRAAQDAALPPALAEDLLGGQPRTDVLPATGDGTGAPDLQTLSRGRRSVLLPEDVVPLSDPFALTFTPDAVAEVSAGGDTWTAVLSDTTLSADAAGAVEGSPLALTRVLARLATTTLQRPNDARLLAVALPADLDPAPGGAERVADALAGTAWAQPVRLSTALGTPPADAARADLPTARDPDVEGVQDLLDAVEDGRRVAAAVAAPEDPVAAAALDLRAAATLSRSAAPDAAATLAARLREQTSGTVAGVQVVPGSRVTLVAAQAALPVTVVNELTTEVALVLEVRSRSPRLQVPESRVPVTVQPGQRAVVDVPVVAVASGVAEVTSQLVTADGRAWGEPSTVRVTVSTQAEGRVLTGVGVGVGVLFVLGAARAFVRNRRGRELVGAGPVEP